MNNTNEAKESNSSSNNKKNSSRKLFSLNNFMGSKHESSTPTLKDFENINTTKEELKKTEGKAAVIRKQIFKRKDSKAIRPEVQELDMMSGCHNSERIDDDIENSQENINIASDEGDKLGSQNKQEIHQIEQKQEVRNSNQKSHLKFLQFLLGGAVRQPAQK
jgi:hypothetical protein